MGDVIRGVILAPHPHTQGAVPRIAEWLASALTESGWQVDVWPWGKRSDDEGLLTKVTARTTDVFDIVTRLREAGGTDLLVVKSGLDWKSVTRDLLLVTFARRHAATIILQPHGSQSERLRQRGDILFKWVAARLFRRVDAVFLLSSEEVSTVRSFSPGTRAFLVRNPYDPACLDSVPVEIREDAYRVLFVGRMIKEKGVLELVTAAADSDGRGTLSVRFVGEGPVLDQAKELAAELGVSDQVTFGGLAVGSDAVRDAYVGSDVLALPSYSEGFPTVVAEAMGFGLPVVCTRIRGAVDYLADGTNVLFVEPRDVQGLRDALIVLRDDIETRKRMAEANLRCVQSFAPDVVAAHYRGCIEQVRSLQPEAHAWSDQAEAEEVR